MSSFPSGPDTFVDPDPSQPGNSPKRTDLVKKLNAAARAVQATLGLNPQGIYPDIATRLANLPSGGGGSTPDLGPDAALASQANAGAGSINIRSAPSAMFNSRAVFLAIDEGSLSCEYVQVESASGSTINLQRSLWFTHTAGAPVRWVRDGFSCPTMYGARAVLGSSDDTFAVQRSFLDNRCSGNAGTWNAAYNLREPVFHSQGGLQDIWLYQDSAHWRSTGQVSSPLAAGPQATGYTIQHVRSWSRFTATGSSNTIVYNGDSIYVLNVGDRITFNNPLPTGTLPSGITSGRTYWIRTLNTGTRTITISGTSDLAAELDIGDGSGMLYTTMESVTQRDFWRNVRLELNVPDTSGIYINTNQPDEFRNTQVIQNSAASAPGKSVGMRIDGNGCTLSNTQYTVAQNCLGGYWTATWIVHEGFLGLNDGLGQGLKISGQATQITWADCESNAPYGIELISGARSFWLGLLNASTTNGASFRDSSTDDTSWVIERINANSSNEVIISSARTGDWISFDSNLEGGLCDPHYGGGRVQQTGGPGGQMTFGDRSARIAINGDFKFSPRYDLYVCPVSATRVGTIHSAAGIGGTPYTIKNTGSANVEIRSTGGTLLFTVTPGTTLKIISDGASWVTN